MTLPFERLNAVLNAEKFLIELQTESSVPHEIRHRASRVLRHYPTKLDMEIASKQTSVFNPDEINRFADPVSNVVKDIINIIDSNGTLTIGTKTTELKLDVKRASIEEAVLETIRKCCEICDSFSEECSDESHSEAIKKHFGVE